MTTTVPPLHLLHIPRTGGTALGAMLEDQVGGPGTLVAWNPPELDAVDPRRWDDVRFVQSHAGLVPRQHLPADALSITVLRDPVATTASRLSRGLRFESDPTWSAIRARGYGVADVIGDRRLRWVWANSQARVLAADIHPHAWPRAARLVAKSDPWWRSRARSGLAAVEIVGVAERSEQLMHHLAARFGWPPPLVDRRNLASPTTELDDESLSIVRRSTAIDRQLHQLAGERFDEQVASTVAIAPAPPPLVDRLHLTMDQPFAATGMHRRITDAEVGWHRWTGPSPAARVRPWVRLRGPAAVRIEVISACSDQAVRGIDVRVQGRPVRHTLADRGPGRPGVVVDTESVDLDGDLPFELEIRSGEVRRFVEFTDAIDDGSDAVGLAVGDIEVAPVPR